MTVELLVSLVSCACFFFGCVFTLACISLREYRKAKKQEKEKKQLEFIKEALKDIKGE